MKGRSMNSKQTNHNADQRPVIIVSNRGPISASPSDDGTPDIQRNSGGLVTALIGLAQQIDLVWLACAESDVEAKMGGQTVPLNDGSRIRIEFVSPERDAYEGYYNVIANPLLWFLQHSMWNVSLDPVIDRATWRAWEQGYVAVNHLFAEKLFRLIRGMRSPPLIMFQDYHLYLAPRFFRQLRQRRRPTVVHFIHIPWPGPEYWGVLPPTMRQAILDGLCAVDLLGFQTREDGLNFIRACESYLPTASVKYKYGLVWYKNHKTHVRDFPISIDANSLRERAASSTVAGLRNEIQETIQDRKLILRVDRIEPSKNIVRGFQAFKEMLENHPEHIGKVVFLALLAPSRQDVEEYQRYLDALMAAAGRVNVSFGNYEWEPVRILVGDDYDRAIAALQVYDVLLVTAIADGMNLVAKEGPIVNRKDGVLILSDRAGARQQLESGATIIPPCDIFATAEALHQGLIMDQETRQVRAARLRWLIESNDINAWIESQLNTLRELRL
jgi:trehalose 6-phosphate synthase